MRTHGVHLVAERLGAAVEGFERQGADGIGPLAEPLGLDHGPNAVGAHELRAVEQRQPLLGLQLDGLPPHFGQHLRSRAHLALMLDLAEPEKRQAHVGQRRQVARSTERTLLIDNREYVVVEEVDKTLDGSELHARMAVGKRLDFQQQNQPHDLGRNPLARAAGVRHDKVLLQGGQVVAADRNVAQRTEPRGDAVDGPLGVLHLAVEVLAATDDAPAGVVGERQPEVLFEDFADPADRKMFGGNMVKLHRN